VRCLAFAEEFSVLGRIFYDGAVLGVSNLGRRLVEGVVGLFAVLGFLYVPLGRHTGFEHAKAVFSTPAAAAAFQELSGAMLDLRERAVELVTGHDPRPVASPLPPAKGSGRQPRPVPPTLK
jgi:hypothetical protein